MQTPLWNVTAACLLWTSTAFFLWTIFFTVGDHIFWLSIFVWCVLQKTDVMLLSLVWNNLLSIAGAPLHKRCGRRRTSTWYSSVLFSHDWARDRYELGRYRSDVVSFIALYKHCASLIVFCWHLFACSMSWIWWSYHAFSSMMHK